MTYINYFKSLITTLLLVVCLGYSYGQEIGGNAYLMGTSVEVGVDGNLGREGTTDIPGSHARGGAAGAFGFVANPAVDGWGVYDGDFFMPGTPENGWGLEFNGNTYSNNYNVNEIPIDPAKPISHTVDGSCITVEWDGIVGGVSVNIKYHLFEEDLFYTTEVTLVNTTGTDITDFYYYRNVDPDNNQSIGGGFPTTNTVVSQPEIGGECQKALVSAEQTTPHDSYLGFGALGSKFRVCYGGFSNRDASDIWTGTGFTNTVGSTTTSDIAISLGYKDDIDAGDTINFTFAVVLSEDALESAFSSLYYIDYESDGADGGSVISECNPSVDSVQSCAGRPVTLSVEGPNDEDYDWVWTPDTGLSTDTGPVTEASPLETTTYTVTGTPTSACLTNTVSKTIVVVYSEGPQIEITDPGPYCEDFDLTTLEFEDLNDTEGSITVFLSEIPDSSSQTEPAWPSDMMGPGDNVYLMIGDTVNGCYDWQQVIIDFGGLGAAGDDSTITLCGQSGVTVDLHDLISDGANTLGDFTETTFSGQFNAATGILDVSGLSGTYTFDYTVDGVDPCPDDEAVFTVVVNPQPVPNFEYEAGGLSSADGLASTCIINTVSVDDLSSLPGGGTIDNYLWDFGDGFTSTLTEPSHLYATVGEYTITLTVTTAGGCTATYTKDIIIYAEPVLDIIFNDPVCNGFSDGSVTAFVAGGSGTFDIEIRDEDGVMLNAAGSNTANSLTAGTYFVTVTDASGCSATGSVTLTDPPALDVFYRVVEPSCFGGTGYIVVDSVTGKSINNEILYFWSPNPVDPSYGGYDADSLYNVTAGTYTLTVNDSKGCSNIIDITVNEPTQMVWNELGFEPAYCRTKGYQSGNGVVFAAASGGTLPYTSAPNWTEVSTGTTASQGTWGGRNPGVYNVTITDDNGCVLDGTVTVDSLNPIAAFTVSSDQLNEDCKGTADVEVEFTNTSQNYANPNNPNADPRFYWDLDHNTGDSDWDITGDYTYKPDTTYEARGVTYDIEVCLVVQNKNDCKDTACKIITVFEPITFVNVNIFTPNGDGVNDVFTFSQYAASVAKFNCVILNRWGNVVGEINTINGAWDGTDKSGSKCNDGTYFYKYAAEADNGEKFEGQGTVQISGSTN